MKKLTNNQRKIIECALECQLVCVSAEVSWPNNECMWTVKLESGEKIVGKNVGEIIWQLKRL
jgi:hypothetical protein